jgi:phage terminase small subunit
LQQRFVDEYLLDLNASAAAGRAGLKGKRLDQAGYALLRKAEVQAAVQALQAKRSERTAITADVVLGELLRIARSDLGAAFDDNGQLKPLKEIPEDVRRAIASVETETRQEVVAGSDDEAERITVRKIKFWDKTRSLELLARHLGLLKDKLEVTGKVTLEQLVANPPPKE